MLIRQEFDRSLDDILFDFLNFLCSKGLSLDVDAILRDAGQRSVFLEELIKRCYDVETGLWYFITFVIGPESRTGKQIWNKFVADQYEIIKNHRNIALMASRGLGKSYFYSVLYPIYLLYLFQRVEILIINNTSQQIKANFDKLKEIIEQNELLMTKRAKKDEITWNEKEIWYNRGKIFAASVGTQTRGKHVNLVILDDILRDDGTYSDEYIKRYFSESVFPVVQKFTGRIILIGTPQSRDDIFHNYMEDENGRLITDGAYSSKGFYSKVFPAIVDMEKRIPYMENWLSLERLEGIRRTMGELSFAKEYQCVCVSDKTSIFPENLLTNVFDAAFDWEECGREDGVYYIGADIATSGEASADFSAFTVLEYQESQFKEYRRDFEVLEKEVRPLKKIVRHIVHVKGMKVKDQVNTLEQLSGRFNNAYILVEKNNVGVALLQELEDRGLNVGAVRSDSSKKSSAINYLKSEMQRGHFFIPDTDREEIINLKKELKGFGIRIRKGKELYEAVSVKHDDLVDSLYWANLATQMGTSGISYAICQD